MTVACPDTRRSAIVSRYGRSTAGICGVEGSVIVWGSWGDNACTPCRGLGWQVWQRASSTAGRPCGRFGCYTLPSRWSSATTSLRADVGSSGICPRSSIPSQLLRAGRRGLPDGVAHDDADRLRALDIQRPAVAQRAGDWPPRSVLVDFEVLRPDDDVDRVHLRRQSDLDVAGQFQRLALVLDDQDV
jgi:hypothetical protein